MDQNEPFSGGRWTDIKLAILKDYLNQYLRVMSKQGFRPGYIDAFAGTGQIANVAPSGSLFEMPGETEAFRDGSARIALETWMPFDFYVFIEQDADKVRRLEELKAEYPDLRILVRPGDANQLLQRYARIDWHKEKLRAVVFVDPYGMQVDWRTLEALAATKAVDVWLLVPIGIGANRLLPRTLSQAPKGWLDRLDRFFGTSEWRDHFYETRQQREASSGRQLNLMAAPDPAEDESVKRVSIDEIAEFFMLRLRELFPHVASNPRLLHNSRGNPMYMLCFACANPSPAAGRASLNIAGHLLKRFER